MELPRRHFVASALAAATLPQAALAKSAKEITWNDLIPPGVPYSQIIGEGEMDEAADTWRPVFDENATKLNPALDGAYIKMPGFILPFDITTAGVTSFVLVPYVGACLHTPPPPANQLVFVTPRKPWPSQDLWEAVWVTGKMTHELQATEVADTGYALTADKMEIYVW
ncbi:DUF3299 domain-containing protein [Sulfitobacter donghicola]|uniref:DUF3299 domain-containing protein n=1 Tax=Sulfitobacter donghicola DSW-25 = KCTC 12864 = JCM 14565 TaxID=1300350 RepID=A0A073IK02_9RHOB|nr:DUF3299 domain-containing protein [Sulfitobacter donghicola]KEJ90059.1 hypothetical protein DSW25_07580 [Sulfitobacter donghicola DSW-25 = KCTC 12864 = JCM 14565]KIN66797.1 DUF3299 domain containing protein [Sulfitobacter donghicola DSW-25 = KCTC 12864 = JCM 14565]